jgi:hypothetical protein
MPLSYCSMAWAIQPTVRPMIKSPRPALLGSPSPIAAAARAKFGAAPDQPLAGFGSFRRERVDFGRGLRENRQNGCRTRVALGIERLAKAGQTFAARKATSHHRHWIVALQELSEQTFGTGRLAAMAVAG